MHRPPLPAPTLGRAPLPPAAPPLSAFLPAFPPAFMPAFPPPFPKAFLPVLLALTLGGLAAPSQAAGAKPSGNAVAGKAAFNKCASCHQVGPSARGGFGPQLNGIVGRRAAATDYAYSAAMKKSNIVWNEAALAAFLKAPSDVVPDTKMRFWGIGNEQQLADLLAYLRTL